VGWEFVPIWIVGMALMCVVGSRLREIEDREREHLFRKPYPSEFALSLWGVRGSEEYQKQADEWFRVDAIERHKWRAGQPARNREKWKLRFIILGVAIVFFGMLMAIMIGG